MNQELRPAVSAATSRARFFAGIPVGSLLLLLVLSLLSGCFVGHHGSPKSVSAVTVAVPPPVIRTVVRPAPDFAWVGAGGKTSPLRALRGQPVVLLIASSPEEKDFRKQVEHIDKLYLDLSERKTVFLAAFTVRPGRVPSNVPYAIAQDGAAVGKAYGVPPGGLGVAVISPNGNLDLFSTQVQAAQRLLDMINNSYQVQAAGRTGLGS
jgi:hypothetical protein